MGDYLTNKARDASKLLSGARLTASQAVDQLKALPQNAANVGESMRSIPGFSDVQPDGWDMEAALRAAKARLLGLWRGYVAPVFR